MNAGIKDIMIISTPNDLPRFRNLFKDGKHIGLNISYREQLKPKGIAESFIIADDFIGNNNVCLILGDNIFHGNHFNNLLDKARLNLENNYSTIFGVEVDKPNEFGVVEFDSDNKINNIVEKPDETISKLVVSGLYYYTNDVVNIAKNLKPSSRGELEITDINNQYIENKNMIINIMDENFTWLDTGTFDSLYNASKFVKVMQEESNLKLGLIEEIAYLNHFINKKQLEKNLLNLSEDFKNYIKEKYL
jgi:glucose-1-phosphate thymidylyltransferase